MAAAGVRAKGNDGKTNLRQRRRGIDWADVVVANMDGPDPDSGTCWECGYAYRRKPVILFRTDFRAGHEMRDDLLKIEEQNNPLYNLMLTEAATERLDLRYAAVDRVADSIDQALRNLAIGDVKLRK